MNHLWSFAAGVLVALGALIVFGRWSLRRGAGAPPSGTVPTSSGVMTAKLRVREHAVAILNADDGGRRRVVESQQESAS